MDSAKCKEPNDSMNVKSYDDETDLFHILEQEQECSVKGTRRLMTTWKQQKKTYKLASKREDKKEHKSREMIEEEKAKWHFLLVV